MLRYCKSCKLFNKNKNICGLTGFEVDLNTDFCSKHQTEIETCEICHNIMAKNNFIIHLDNENIPHTVCANCHMLLQTCQACPKAQTCAFETDPNPLPKMVVKQIRQGNAVMQTTVKNEERIKAICPTCECWSEESGCLREYNTGCIKKEDFWTV